MPSHLDNVTCASIPLAALPLLAKLRGEPGLRIALTAGRAWLHWETGSAHVLAAVLPIHGVDLFSFEEGRWHRPGQALPAFDMPKRLEYQPAAHVLFPGQVQPLGPIGAAWQPTRLTLQADDHPRPTSALLCALHVLSAWCDTAASARLGQLNAARCGDQALVMGSALPALADAERFWGRRILVPLGMAPCPALPEGTLGDAIGMEDEEVVLMRDQRVEVIPASAFTALSRSGLRQAQKEAAT